MNQPITSLFSLQSTKGEKLVCNEDHDEDDIEADTGGRNTVYGIEVDMMLKTHENRLKLDMEKIERQHEDRLKLHARNFEYEVQKLRSVAKECHILFVEEIKKVQEFVNAKVEYLKSEMLKEISKIEQSHSSLEGNIDIVVEAIKKLVEYYTSFASKSDVKTDSDSNVLDKLAEFLGSLKESLLKIATSHCISVSQDSLSQMFSSFETIIKDKLAPLLKLVNLMPTNSPTVKMVVQGGEKKVGSSKDPS
ncbi:unnamed protein product [Lactuca saligna]|uniref:Uncharacterized protein n=1 Tax=Lactuca saligna TaxID=75948 RepID=A0AA35VBY2_LACSI|nr:unnamed protein product [Lactuca saligna]